MNISRLVNPKLYSFANKALRKEASETITAIEERESHDMSKKFFALDHTAEVLENYRRIKENEIFDKVLHEERQKKAFLKTESQKIENLLETNRFQQPVFELSQRQFLIEGFTLTKLKSKTLN